MLDQRQSLYIVGLRNRHRELLINIITVSISHYITTCSTSNQGTQGTILIEL